MGLFNSISSIFRGRDAPTDRTSGSAYSFFMGGSTSGKRVNERSGTVSDVTSRQIVGKWIMGGNHE